MKLWYPPKDRPQLFDWWRPLVLASRAARLDRCPWPVNVDELVLVGRVTRGPRPSIWVYRHAQAGGELYLDDAGTAYKFTRTPNGRSYGRFSPCTIREAIWQARLPDAVAPVSYRDDGRRDAWDGDADPDGPPDHMAAGDLVPSAAPSAPRRHRHLTVHDGGRSLAG